jgi:prophage antirepressor-like protein
VTDLPIQSFEFQLNRLRVVVKDDEPWFVAADVAMALQYSEASAMTRHLDDDEKGLSIVQTLGGEQEAVIISESGLYSAILRSRKPEAKKFRKWVTAEVLPAIRKTGRYEAPAAALAEVAPQQVQALAIALEARTAEVAQLQVQLIGAQGSHIKTLVRFNALQRRFEAREARNMIIDMARLGHSREAIMAATGRNYNHIRQVIFQAKRAGVLPRDENTTQSVFSFETAASAVAAGASRHA